MSGNGQKKKHRTEDQHYVPQFYLRGFTNAASRMFCYDKVADRSHPTSTQAAAQEPYFYEIPSGSFENVNVPVNTVEKALSVVERNWHRCTLISSGSQMQDESPPGSPSSSPSF